LQLKMGERMRESPIVFLTIDVEDWYHIPSVTGSPFSVYTDVEEFFQKWQDRYDYLTEPTKRILNLLDEFNLRATFFVVADVIEHYPGLVENIAENGHEIACHGLHHEIYIHPKTKRPLLTKEEFKERTKNARKLLKKESKQRIMGYRAPGAYIGGWMVDTLEELGFRYDSSVSVNSLYNKTDSNLQGVSTIPYYPKKGSLECGSEIRKILEIPWPYLDILGFKLPTAGGPMLRFLGARVILMGIKQSLRRGPALFYFHPIDISNEKFPKIGNKRPLYWSIKGEIVEKRIRYILRKLLDMRVNLIPISEYMEEVL